MIALREFQPGDEAALRMVFESAVRETARRDYAPAQIAAWAPSDHDPQEWAERMQRLRPFVAIVDGVAAGYADLQPDGFVDHFFVAAWAGGRGVGGALMRRLLARAQALGLPQLSAHVSLTAQPFFARFGFEVVEHRVVEVRGVQLGNAEMHRRLKDAGR